MKNETKKDMWFVLKNTAHEWYTHLIIAAVKILITLCTFTTPIIQSLIIDCGLNFQPDQPLSVNAAFQYLVSGAFGVRGSLKLIIILATLFVVVTILTDVLKTYKYIARQNLE